MATEKPTPRIPASRDVAMHALLVFAQVLSIDLLADTGPDDDVETPTPARVPASREVGMHALMEFAQVLGIDLLAPTE